MQTSFRQGTSYQDAAMRSGYAIDMAHLLHLAIVSLYVDVQTFFPRVQPELCVHPEEFLGIPPAVSSMALMIASDLTARRTRDDVWVG